MYFSIILFSNTAPDDGETTGTSGTSLDTAYKYLGYKFTIQK